MTFNQVLLKMEIKKIYLQKQGGKTQLMAPHLETSRHLDHKAARLFSVSKGRQDLPAGVTQTEAVGV